jgi:hypothetical protein
VLWYAKTTDSHLVSVPVVTKFRPSYFVPVATRTGFLFAKTRCGDGGGDGGGKG